MFVAPAMTRKNTTFRKTNLNLNEMSVNSQRRTGLGVRYLVNQNSFD